MPGVEFNQVTYATDHDGLRIIEIIEFELGRKVCDVLFRKRSQDGVPSVKLLVQGGNLNTDFIRDLLEFEAFNSLYRDDTFRDLESELLGATSRSSLLSCARQNNPLPGSLDLNWL